MVDQQMQPTNQAVPFQLQRLGIIMEPEPGNPHEEEGVLNPAAARGRDNHLYLFPRLVAPGNYSRIGIARVKFASNGDPVGVERLGIALEPQADYERNGCEDPRITFVPSLDVYVMTYTAFGPRGARIALAVSPDLFDWERLGLVRFTCHEGVDFGDVPNKDALIFPEPVPNAQGHLSLGLIHRPLFPGTEPRDLMGQPERRAVDLPHESIWLSYCSFDGCKADLRHLCDYQEHYRVASPSSPWERVKVGGGSPPLPVLGGWLLLYHGVSGDPGTTTQARRLRYSAGALLLDRHDPRLIRYRSPMPILEPELAEERSGIVANVVFPTAADQRVDLNQPERIDVYYGMADNRIGAARLQVPTGLPPGALADPHEGWV